MFAPTATMLRAEPCASGLSGSTHSTAPVGSATCAGAGSATATASAVPAAMAAANPLVLILIPFPLRFPAPSITARPAVKA